MRFLSSETTQDGRTVLWSARVRSTVIGFRIDRRADRRVHECVSLLSVWWLLSERLRLCLAQLRCFLSFDVESSKQKNPKTSKQSCCVQLNYTSTQPEISRRHHSDQRKSKAFQVKHTRVITNEVNIFRISSFSGFIKSTDRWIFTSAQGRTNCCSLLVILCYFALKSRVQAWKGLENLNKCKEKCSCFRINYWILKKKQKERFVWKLGVEKLWNLGISHV